MVATASTTTANHDSQGTAHSKELSTTHTQTKIYNSLLDINLNHLLIRLWLKLMMLIALNMNYQTQEAQISLLLHLLSGIIKRATDVAEQL